MFAASRRLTRGVVDRCRGGSSRLRLSRLSRLRLSRLGARMVDLLLPPTCFACGKGIEGPEVGSPAGCCAECWGELSLFGGPCCQRCAAPLVLAGGQPLNCTRCQKAAWRFDGAVAAGEYGAELRRLVLLSKRPTGQAIAIGLGRAVWHVAADRLTALQPDAIAPVPMHWRRRLSRRTNPPELIAEVLAEKLRQQGRPASLATRLLARTRPTRPQASVARSQRLPNVRNAFSVRRGYRLRGATVLLVDDILTTGATASEAARALKAAGAGRVVLVVAAKSL